MSQQNLYYRTQLETKVSLFPEQLNAKMDEHLLENLKQKIEGKTNEHGIVIQITKLIDYEHGMIDKANFMGVTVFKVKYECFICSPTKNLNMICVVENIIKGFLVARNGPVIVAIQSFNIDPKIFDIKDGNIIHIKTKKPIEKGDFLKVSIINPKNNLGEKNIVAMCKLLNMATKNEIQVFENDQLLAKGINQENENVFI